MVDFRPYRETIEYNKGVEIVQINPVSENRDHSNSVDALSVNPVNRSNYASGSHDKTIKIWDANTNRCSRTMEGHADGIWSLSYFSDGR